MLANNELEGEMTLFTNQLRITHHKLRCGKGAVRVAHLTDLHLSDRTSLPWLKTFTKTIQSLKPDLLLFTGDFVAAREKFSNPEPYLRLFKKLNIPRGTFAILGNHDIKGANGRAKALLQQAGFFVLENEIVHLSSKGKPDISIGGLSTMQYGKGNIKSIQSLRHHQDSLRLLMMHEPQTAEKLLPKTADLILAGHTHQGQIHIPGLEFLWLPVLSGKYVHGHYRVHQTPLYVSAGLGESGVSFRFCAKRELAIFDFI